MGNKALMKRIVRKTSRSTEKGRYHRFRGIDGRHDFRKSVPNGFVDYGVRTRPGGRVAYFNFDLAKEMGLIPESHPHKMNSELSKIILHTFAIQIINEYDIINKTPIPKETIRPYKYMATRYLQLQHPDKTGTTSGDGRSIWNGQVRHKGVTWDISSCGTGATRLSPATAIEKKFFKTGDDNVSYGCGYAFISDGISGALMSEIFYKSGVPTERTLGIIEFKNGISIVIRAGTNLLRPSHFFSHLKQANLQSLRGAIDYYIDRQVKNGIWPDIKNKKKRYEKMAEMIAICFARAAAKFESDYIFVWMDWDGDNILADGGIIDYGSVRQFGLYHHEYRYDDDDRWSTTIAEQKLKARNIVQTFAQIRDFLVTGKRVNRNKFNKDPVLKVFDREFEEEKIKNLVYKIGFGKDERDFILKSKRSLLVKFQKVFSYFEMAKSSRGSYSTDDGVTWDAVYCMRDILRELPVFVLSKKRPPMGQEFLDIIASSYATRRDRKLTPQRTKKIHEFIDFYLELVVAVARKLKVPMEKVLLEVTMRSSLINQYDRITGDSILLVTEQILRDRRTLTLDELQTLMEDFINYQKITSNLSQSKLDHLNSIEDKKSKRIRERILKLVQDSRESL